MEKITAAVLRLKELGAEVGSISLAKQPNYEIRIPMAARLTKAAWVEIGYLMAQLTEATYPGDFGSASGIVRIFEHDEVIRFDVDPMFMYFRLYAKSG